MRVSNYLKLKLSLINNITLQGNMAVSMVSTIGGSRSLQNLVTIFNDIVAQYCSKKQLVKETMIKKMAIQSRD